MSMMTSEPDIQRLLDEDDWLRREENCPIERRRLDQIGPTGEFNDSLDDIGGK